MKKSIKKTISVCLIILCTFSVFDFAFAVNEKMIINGTEYECYGELPLNGRTEIDCEPYEEIVDLNVYYEFNVNQNGYYSIGYGTPHTDMTVTFIEKSVADGTSDYSYIYYETSMPNHYYTDNICYLESGEYILLVQIDSSAVEVRFATEYLGDRVTDYVFKYDMLLNSDIDSYNGQFNSEADAEITFSSGKVLDYYGNTFGYINGNDLIDGENKLTVVFCKERIETTATVYDISHYVKEAQLSNAEYYIEQVAESGNHVHPVGETVTVYFADGTIHTIEVGQGNCYITLPNGREYPLYFSYAPGLFYSYLEIYIGGNIVGEVTYQRQSGYSVSELFSKFTDDAKDVTEEIKENIKFAVENIDFSNPESVMEALETIILSCILLLNIPAGLFEIIMAMLII